MGLLKAISRKVTIWQYQYYERNIIEGISSDVFSRIISTYEAEGWEVRSNQSLVVPTGKAWKGLLRKGSIILNCEFCPKALGSIYGPARVIKGLGNDFNLQVQLHPA